jgi:phosphoglycolate phosphatase
VTCGAHSEMTLKQYHPLCCLSYSTELLGII